MGAMTVDKLMKALMLKFDQFNDSQESRIERIAQQCEKRQLEHTKVCDHTVERIKERFEIKNDFLFKKLHELENLVLKQREQIKELKASLISREDELDRLVNPNVIEMNLNELQRSFIEIKNHLAEQETNQLKQGFLYDSFDRMIVQQVNLNKANKDADAAESEEVTKTPNIRSMN